MGIPVKKLPELSLEAASPNANSPAPGPRLAPISTIPGDDLGFWKDVFVERPLPWSRFLQSGVLHLTAAVLIWATTIAWLRNQKILGPTPFDKSSLITYAPNEYLPLIDTGPPAAPAPQDKKGDLAFNKQPILSVPREPDNRSQTIVAPTDLKLDHNVPLPNIIATGAIAPVVPLDATRAQRSVNAPDQQVVAPAPDANFTRDRSQSLRADIVPPPPDVTHDRARGINGPEASIVEPPPTVTNTRTRVGSMNIAPSQVVAPAPQLALAEQHTLGRGRGGKGLPGSAEPVAPPPSISSGGGGSQGRLVALSINPAAPTGPVAVPNGNRRGTFAAGPNGHAGASGNPDLSGGKSGSNGAGGTAIGSGSKGRANGSLPSGIHVGAGPGQTGPIQRDGKSPSGAGFGDGENSEVASLTPAQRAAAKQSRPASKVSDDKITDLDRQVFGGRRPYGMTVNMPNLNSFTGSWVLRFAELKQDQKEGELLTPVPMEKTDPGYPLELMKNNVHGQVTLYAIIHSDGRVGDVRVLSSPDDRLDHYAVTALKQWKFAPAEKDGKAIAIEAVVIIPFKTRSAF